MLKVERARDRDGVTHIIRHAVNLGNVIMWCGHKGFGYHARHDVATCIACIATFDAWLEDWHSVARPA